jgi:hypothetical protein
VDAWHPGRFLSPIFSGTANLNLFDLYTLSLTSDNAHNVRAQLVFGLSGSPFFDLQFLNSMGLPFDPASPGALDAIEKRHCSCIQRRSLAG